MASPLILLLGVSFGHAGKGDGPLKDADPESSRKLGGEAATAVIVAPAATACFSSMVRGAGLLTPRAEAVAGFAPDGFAVAEIFASEGDLIGEGQPLARLARIGGEAGAARAGQTAGAAAPGSIVLRAPAAGVVVKSTAKIGAAVSPQGEPLFRLAVDGLIEVDAEVSSIDLGAIKEGQTARIEAEPEREMAGRVRKIGAEINPATQMGHVRIEIARDAGLRAGRFVRATIDARRSCGISAPRSAVLYKTDGTSVQVVRDDVVETLRVTGWPHLRPTTPRFEAGLHAGELVVAHAGASLRDGDQSSPVLARSRGPTGGAALMAINVSAWSIRHPLPAIVFALVMPRARRGELQEAADHAAAECRSADHHGRHHPIRRGAGRARNPGDEAGRGRRLRRRGRAPHHVASHRRRVGDDDHACARRQHGPRPERRQGRHHPDQRQRCRGASTSR